jgi:hypothetical protein
MARPKFYAYHLRRAALRLFVDGWSYRKIEAHTKVKITTFRGWAKDAGILPNSHLTDEELDQKIEMWRERFADNEEMQNKRAEMSAQEQLQKINEDRRKFGLTQQEKAEAAGRSWSELQALGMDPDEWKLHMAATMERTVTELANAASPEQQVNALQASIGLTQLRELAANPPPITNWADALRVVSLTRQALGMDKDDGNKDTEAADIRVLTAKVDHGKVIEISSGKKGPKKKKRG